MPTIVNSLLVVLHNTQALHTSVCLRQTSSHNGTCSRVTMENAILIKLFQVFFQAPVSFQLK